MDILAFIPWVIIIAFVYALSLLALKFTTIRIVLVLLAFLPIVAMLAFFIMRIPPLAINEPHKAQFFARWKVGGHRGSAHDGIPENSLQAMSQVKTEGGQLVEMDIQITADGVPVICHDSNVKSATGVDRDIGTMTLDEFKRLTYNATNITLPTFVEAVEHCVANDLMMIWDVKRVDEPLLTQFVTQIRTRSLYDKVLVAGFNPIDMYLVKIADPKILTGFTWRSWELSTSDESATSPRFTGALHAIATLLDVFVYALARSFIIPKFIGADMIFYNVNDVSRYLSTEALANNMFLGTWTSNSVIEMRWLKNYLRVPFLTDNVSMAP